MHSTSAILTRPGLQGSTLFQKADSGCRSRGPTLDEGLKTEEIAEKFNYLAVGGIYVAEPG